MEKTKREIKYVESDVYQDVVAKEDPSIGLIALDCENDPKPSIQIHNGKIIEMDGKKENEFDMIDQFIARYGINKKTSEKYMAMDSTLIAKQLVDINIPRKQLIDIITSLTPAKIVEVVSKLNVVEIMMAQMKMRARKTPANQAHAVNIGDNPILAAADSAEAALRGFAEVETTCNLSRYAPLFAIALLIGGQAGRPGVITQCSMEEASELKIGMKGFTSYAETLSVYGTDPAMSDGGDTPWSKSFLAAAYTSRGMKLRFSSGSASEVMMGNSEGKSMLYLEIRCLWLVKSCGSQGVQNGAIDGLPIIAAMPSGFRSVAMENLVASMLGLEVASGNDTYFTHSPIRKATKLMMQFLPGTDLVTSGMGSIPNKDSTFTGSTFDCDNYPDFYMMQRDMKVDGGIIPVDFEDVIKVRLEAAKAMQVLFKEADFPEITDEEVEAAVYAYSSDDMPPRNVVEDTNAGKRIMDSSFCSFDVVKILYKNGFEKLADNILKLLRQRVVGDYLQTSAIFNEKFEVISAINNENDYQGPGSGYVVSNERWAQLQGGTPELDVTEFLKKSGDESSIYMEELGEADYGSDPDEVIISVGPAFAAEMVKTIIDVPHEVVIRELMAGIEEEGMKSRIIKCYSSSDLSIIASSASKLSGSGIAIGVQSRGTVMIHQKDLVPLENLELFSLSPQITPDIFRKIGRNAAKYAKKETPEPLPGVMELSTRHFMMKTTMLHNYETKYIVDRQPQNVKLIIK